MVHHIYGLYRDGEPLPPLFHKSSEVWQGYCRLRGADPWLTGETKEQAKRDEEARKAIVKAAEGKEFLK